MTDENSVAQKPAIRSLWELSVMAIGFAALLWAGYVVAVVLDGSVADVLLPAGFFALLTAMLIHALKLAVLARNESGGRLASVVSSDTLDPVDAH